MFTIEIFLSKHWSEVEELPENERFFSIRNIEAAQAFFNLSSDNFYNYGKVAFVYNNKIFLSEECEIDFFLSSIQFEKENIYSGIEYTAYNSYFGVGFLLENTTLNISFRGNKIRMPVKEFADAFANCAEMYYTLLASYHKEKENYLFLLDDVKQWRVS